MAIAIILSGANMGDVDELDYDLWAWYVAQNERDEHLHGFGSEAARSSTFSKRESGSAPRPRPPLASRQRRTCAVRTVGAGASNSGRMPRRRLLPPQVATCDRRNGSSARAITHSIEASQGPQLALDRQIAFAP